MPNKIGGGKWSRASQLTVGEYLAGEWLPAAERRLRPLSVKRYRSLIRTYIAPGVGSVKLQALSAGHLNGLYADLEVSGLSPATVRLTHALIGRSLKDAERWGRVTRNVARMADPPARGRTKAKAWTASELARFLDHVADDRLFGLWRLAATTGMRRGELLGATWRGVDLEGARLSVEQQLVSVPGGLSFGPPKSARSRRTVALDAVTVDVLRVHREAQLLERDFAGDAYQDGDLVFCDELGGPIHPDHLSAWFVKCRREAGVPTGTLHTLRHTAATLALTSGVPVHIVAARHGDDPNTVLSTYAHLLPQSDELAAERVAAALTTTSDQ